MYLYKNDLLPNSFNAMFLHSYNTRSKNAFRSPSAAKCKEIFTSFSWAQNISFP